MAPTISIIVPVYNSERWLRDCVNSLLSQGLDEGEYEIILVDDGSLDQSGEICDELGISCPCIKVIHQRNKGQSEARNAGINASCGSYLCFVDADDSLAPNGLKSLMPFCESGMDLVRFWCEIVYGGPSPTCSECGNGTYFSTSGHDYLKKYGLETFCWNYLYRVAFLKENDLFFTPGIIGEDFSYMFDVMMADPRIVCVSRRIYRYNTRPESTSTVRTPDHSRKWVEDLLGTMVRIDVALTPYRESIPQLYSRCKASLDQKMIPLFSRILTSNYTVKEFRAVRDTCRNAGLLPVRSEFSGKEGHFYKSMIGLLSAVPLLYPLFAIVYSKVFLSLFYPKMKRKQC